MVLVTQQYLTLPEGTVHFQITKTVSFMLCVFYHNTNIAGRGGEIKSSEIRGGREAAPRNENPKLAWVQIALYLLRFLMGC